MSIQFKRGTGVANDGYTGLDGSISLDFTNDLIRVHDGVTAGGAFSVGASGTASTDLSVNYTTSSFTVTSSSGTDAVVNAATGSTAGALTSADKTKLDGIATGADNYSSWTISDGVNSEPVGSGSSLIVADGGATTATYNPTNNTLTISSTDTNTTYTAGTGLTLTGTTFSLNGEVYTSAEKTKLSGIEAGAEVNDPYASQAQAQAGTATTVVMSPLRTVELIEAGNYVIDEGTI